jgi:TP901 family phage tail tape measure protein
MAVSVDEIKILVKAETNKAIKDLKKLQGQTQKTKVGFKDIALGAVGFNGITTAINIASSAVRGAIKTIVDFDQAIANAGSVSGVAKDELRELALEAGRNTKFSAVQAADALYFLGSAGIDTAETMRNTLTPALNLAAAANIGIADATDIAVNNMKVFNQEGLTATDTADVMAQTVRKSNTDFRQLAEALKVAGADAALSGVKFKDLNVLIGALANQGIKGSEAGIKLRQTFIRLRSGLAPVTKTLAKYGITQEEVNKLLPTPLKLFARLRKANISAGDATKIFGARQGAVFGLIKNNLKNYQKLQKAIVGTGKAYKGAAKETAALQLDTITGQLALLKSAWDDIVLTVAGDSGFTSGIKEALKLFVAIVREFGKLVKTEEFVKAVDTAWRSLILGFKIAFELIKTIGKAIFLAFQPLIRIWEFIARVAVDAFLYIQKNWNAIVKWFRVKIRQLISFIRPVIDVVLAIGQAFTYVLKEFIEPFLKGVVDIANKFLVAYIRLLRFLRNSAAKILPKAALQGLDSVISAADKTIKNLAKDIQNTVGSTIKNVKKLGVEGIQIFKDLFKERKKIKDENRKKDKDDDDKDLDRYNKNAQKRLAIDKKEADLKKRLFNDSVNAIIGALQKMGQTADGEEDKLLSFFGNIVKAVQNSSNYIEAIVKVVITVIEQFGEFIKNINEATQRSFEQDRKLYLDNLRKIQLEEVNQSIARLEKEKKIALEQLKIRSAAAKELTAILAAEEEERFENLSEEEKKKVLLQKQVAEEEARIEDEYNRKIEAEKRRQFEIEKEIATLQTFIEQAKAISEINSRFWAPWDADKRQRFKNEIYSQYNRIRELINSRVPQFRNGVENFGGGVAKVHRDEEVYLPPGSSVKTSSQVFSDQNSSSNQMMLSIDNVNVNGVQDAKGLLMELNQIANDMGQNLLQRV